MTTAVFSALRVDTGRCVLEERLLHSGLCHSPGAEARLLISYHTHKHSWCTLAAFQTSLTGSSDIVSLDNLVINAMAPADESTVILVKAVFLAWLTLRTSVTIYAGRLIAIESIVARCHSSTVSCQRTPGEGKPQVLTLPSKCSFHAISTGKNANDCSYHHKHSFPEGNRYCKASFS